MNLPYSHVCTASLKALLKKAWILVLFLLFFLANWKLKFLEMIWNSFALEAVDCGWRNLDFIWQIS